MEASTKKQIATAAGVGATAIAAALTAILSGGKVDCALEQQCKRLHEAARAEILCMDPAQPDQFACMADIEGGYQKTLADCEPLDPKKCAPFVEKYPIDPTVKVTP